MSDLHDAPADGGPGRLPDPARQWRTRADFRAAPGVLLVLRDPPAPPPPARGQPPIVPGNPAEGPEVLLALLAEGTLVLLAGHVDLGTGLQTAYAQIAAEEVDWPLERVQVILGDTARAPNQGPTIASASIQIHAVPLRAAAAQARAWLRAEAAAAGQGDGPPVEQARLLAGRHVELMLELAMPVKPAAEHRLVGQPVPRLDIPAKVSGQTVFVHDMRVPGMLHGRVVRPPYAGVDAGDFVGRCLQAVDEASIAHLSGIVQLVVQGDFIGIVAEREEQAEAAMRALRVHWAPWTPLPPLDDLAQAISANPSTPRVVSQQGEVDAARQALALPMDREYVWPYQMHASIGPSCALAEWHAKDASHPSGALTVWAGTQNPHVLRADLARLTGLPDVAIEVVRMEAAGCYGRNGADDVAADAALLARAVGRPVRVQLTREQEHAWEPKGAAQLMRVKGGLAADGTPLAYDFETSYPSNGAPTLALLLTRSIEPVAQAFEMGDRTSVPPYAYAHQRITVHDMAPILRASWLRGVSALPNSFAHESYIDELAAAAGVDPVEYRLRHLPDARAAELLRATADQAGWVPHTAPQGQGSRPGEPDWLRGQGVAYARYIHSKFPGFGAAWAAWVADVDVHRHTGEVQVRRVVVGHDAGLMVNPAGVQHQVHGNVLQTTSRALKERVSVDPQTRAVDAREWGRYPILSFREVPVVEVMLMPRPGEAPLGAGESSSVPGTAAIANAIFDATGVRLRQPPFTPEVVRAGMRAAQGLPPEGEAGQTAPTASGPAVGANAEDERPAVRASQSPAIDSRDPQRPRKRLGAIVAGLATGLLGLVAAAIGWRPAIAPVAATVQGVYTPQLVERGRQLAALGNCVHCHTAPGGAPLAGGRPIETPFGTLHSTNLTPDLETGVGRWSFSAFQRAMREGVSRDGHHLYPAFPFNAFTQVGDDDLQALYAWVMSQPAVRTQVPPNELRFPFNLRPLMGLWNALHLRPGPVAARADRDAAWNRGAELVNGLGHCGACHTPRDAQGAEREADRYLAGAMVQGWQAPGLAALGHGPLPWTEEALVQYLRQGYSPDHGIAGGPMAPVVRSLAQAAEADVRAIARYLVSLRGEGVPAATAEAPRVTREALLASSRALATTSLGPAQRMFESACGACHHDGDGPQVLGLNLPLALNPNLHAASPDNLLRTLLEGIQAPAFARLGHMPAFREAFDDRQLAELAAYLRGRFAPGQPTWADLPGAVARARAADVAASRLVRPWFAAPQGPR